MNDEIIIEENNIDEIILQDEENDELIMESETIIYKNVNDYNKLKNRPYINEVLLEGNKSLEELDIQHKGDYPENRITNSELEEIFSNW